MTGVSLQIVFYKRIEEFRKRHGKTSALLDDPDKKERAKQALSQITAAFARFLDKSSRFYMSLLRKLLVACNVSLAGYTDHGEDDEGPSFVRCDESSPKHRERKKAMLMSSERCLIFLGDLERYRRFRIPQALLRIFLSQLTQKAYAACTWRRSWSGTGRQQSATTAQLPSLHRTSAIPTTSWPSSQRLSPSSSPTHPSPRLQKSVKPPTSRILTLCLQVLRG